MYCLVFGLSVTLQILIVSHFWVSVSLCPINTNAIHDTPTRDKFFKKCLINSSSNYFRFKSEDTLKIRTWNIHLDRNLEARRSKQKHSHISSKFLIKFYIQRHMNPIEL